MTPDAKDLCVFAVKRGDITGRFDVRNLKYSQSQSGKKQEKVSLGSLTSEEPCYGTSASAIERTDESQPKYIRITDFDDFGIEDNHKFVTTENYVQKHILEIGDILFAINFSEYPFINLLIQQEKCTHNGIILVLILKERGIGILRFQIAVLGRCSEGLGENAFYKNLRI